MGYRKVYLTIEEEEDIERIRDRRRAEGRGAYAYNAILKEGLAMVTAQELTRGPMGESGDGADGGINATSGSEKTHSSREEQGGTISTRRRRGRRRE